MRMWRTMFSISTMASSTSTPATSDSASRLIELSVKSIHCMNAKVGIADSGIASAEIERRAHVAQEQDHTTSTARIEPSMKRAHRRVVRVAWCSRRVVKTCVIVTCGFSLRDLARAPSRRPLSTLTSEEPLALTTPKVVAGRPLRRAMRADLADAVVHVGDVARGARSGPPGSMICVSPSAQRGARAAQHADRLLAAAELGAAAGGVEVELRSCWLTSTAVMPSACMRAGSSSTRISRLTPPPRLTCATPGRRAGAW